MCWVIDRFEGDFAVLQKDTLEIAEVPRIFLPHEAREGDIIKISIDRETTEKRKEDAQKKLRNLFEKHKTSEN